MPLWTKLCSELFIGTDFGSIDSKVAGAISTNLPGICASGHSASLVASCGRLTKPNAQAKVSDGALGMPHRHVAAAHSMLQLT